MANGCGLNAYGSNSQIIRAEGPSAAGPFSFAQTVQLPFAHNPTIRRLPNGTGFVIFFIGGNRVKPNVCNSSMSSISSMRSMSSTSSMSNTSSTSSSGQEKHARPASSNSRSGSGSPPGGLIGGSIHVIFSPTVFGPWSDPIPVEFTNTTDTADSQWLGGGTNPSPHIAADGTVTLALQRTFKANPGKELLGVARAPSWRGPYSMVTPAPIEPQHWYCAAGTGEDPFLWKGRRGGLHVIWHGMW